MPKNEFSEKRIEKLRLMISQHKSVAAFARKYGEDVNQIRQLLNGHRTMGEKLAAKLGRKIANDPNLFNSPDTAIQQ